MPNDVELVVYAVAAMHVSRRASDVQRLAAAVAFDERNHLRCGLAFIEQTSHAQAALQAQRDLGLHVGEFLLDQLIRRERPAELLAIERVMASGMPAEFRRA